MTRLTITGIRELTPAELDAESLRRTKMEFARKATRGRVLEARLAVRDSTTGCLRAALAAAE